MTPEQLKDLVSRYEVYGFYVFGNEIVCSKLKTTEKYFIDKDGCTCKGFHSHGHCKHNNMLKGVWTPKEGTKSWAESELGDVIEIPDDLPEMFNTLFVVDSLPHRFEIICVTLKYESYSMGVTIFDSSIFEQKEFDRILCQQSS